MNLAPLIIAISCFTGTLIGQAVPQGVSKAGSSATESSSATGATNVQSPVAHLGFVPVLISLTRPGGGPAKEIRKEQLSILDTDEVVQPLQMFNGRDIPLHLAIALVSAPASFSQQQAAATSLVQRVLRSKMDKAFVVTARGKKPRPYDRLEWKQDSAELSTMIQRLDRDAGLPDAFNFDLQSDRVLGRWANTTQTFGSGKESFFDAVYYMMSSDPVISRRVLVMFREPFSHSPGIGESANAAVENQLLQTITRAQELHISVFVIGLEDPTANGNIDPTIGQHYASRHVGMDEMDYERVRAYNAGKANLERLSAETGGATFWSTKKNYSDAVNAISNQLENQYLVTFAPRNIPGPVHTLKVSTGDGARVLTQKVFFYAPLK